MRNLKIIQKTFSRQHDQSDCGVACLLSLARYYNGDNELEHLRELSGTSKEGTTLLGLMQAANQMGFEAEGCEADIAAIIDHGQPVILHVVMHGHLSHYVVCYGFENDQFIIGDPGDGIVKLTKEELTQIWQSKTCLTLSPNSDFRTKQSINKSKIAWLKDLLKEDAGILTASVGVGIGIAILSLSMALFKKKLVDNILPDKNIEGLFVGLVVITFILLLKTGLAAMRSTLLIEQSKQFNMRITGDFLGKLLYLPQPFFDTRKIGDFVARLNDTSRIQRVISQLIGSTTIDVIVALVTISALFFFSLEVGLIALSGLVVYFIIIYQYNRQIIHAQKSVMGNYAKNESNYIDIVSGIADIKSFNRYDTFKASNDRTFGEFQESIFDLGKLNISLSMIAGVVSTLLMMSILGFCSIQVLDERMKLGSLFAILGISATMISTVANLAMMSIPINEAKVAFDRMFAFSSIPPENSDITNKIGAFNKIEIRNLSFSFPGRSPLLESINLKLQKGKFITLLGESGSGKSTLLQILQKFYQYEQGQITIDNTDLKSISALHWRDQLAVVPQQVKLFNGTVLYNITLSESTEDYNQAIALCEKYEIDAFINKFPQGFGTIVGEGGINLSGGQQQIVAIVRALLRKPQLLLLDEATSAMDRNTENFILNLLKLLKNDMAVLMVTHRIKTASKSDYIYILEDKTISIQGSPNELLSTDNFYSQAYNDFVVAYL